MVWEFYLNKLLKKKKVGEVLKLFGILPPVVHLLKQEAVLVLALSCGNIMIFKWILYSHLEDSSVVSYKTKLILLPCNPAIAVFGVYPDKLQIYVYTKTCMAIYSSFIYS